jgi:hypothetical protein
MRTPPLLFKERSTQNRSHFAESDGLAMTESKALLVDHHAAVVVGEESQAVLAVSCELTPGDVDADVAVDVVLEIVKPQIPAWLE